MKVKALIRNQRSLTPLVVGRCPMLREQREGIHQRLKETKPTWKSEDKQELIEHWKTLETAGSQRNSKKAKAMAKRITSTEVNESPRGDIRNMKGEGEENTSMHGLVAQRIFFGGGFSSASLMPFIVPRTRACNPT